VPTSEGKKFEKIFLTYLHKLLDSFTGLPAKPWHVVIRRSFLKLLKVHGGLDNVNFDHDLTWL
jgi:hypothetical protein